MGFNGFHRSDTPNILGTVWTLSLREDDLRSSTVMGLIGFRDGFEVYASGNTV